MNSQHKDRATVLGEYMCATGATVRATAAAFRVSKSTVHKDVTGRLKGNNPALYKAVRLVLDKNKEERHIRGGQATKEKYRLKARQVAERESSNDVTTPSGITSTIA